jgi:hypothetical protein
MVRAGVASRLLNRRHLLAELDKETALTTIGELAQDRSSCEKIVGR